VVVLVRGLNGKGTDDYVVQRSKAAAPGAYAEWGHTIPVGPRHAETGLFSSLPHQHLPQGV